MKPDAFTQTIVALGLASVLSAGVFGAFGAIVHYLFLIVKEKEQYYTARLVAFIIMGSFVGIITNEFTEWKFGESYPGLILVSGFLFLKILEFFNASGLDLVLQKLGYNKAANAKIK